MPLEKQTPSVPETTSPTWELRPFEVAALAAAMSICRNMEKPRRVDGAAHRRIEPKDCIQDAYELLSEARKVLARNLAEEALEMAAIERTKVEGEYDPNRSYSWPEVLRCQQKDVQDKSTLAKFFPGKRWHRLESKVKTGEFHFAEKDLTNRPQGFSMLGTITTDEGLRRAIKRLLPDHATEIVESKMLALWQINEILVDQLNRNHGKIPAPRDTKTSPA